MTPSFTPVAAASAIGLLVLVSPSSGQLPRRDVLTLDASEVIVAAAAEKASGSDARVVICVVDDAGFPILLKRLDGAQLASVQVAIDKARTAALFRRPSAVFEDQVTQGRVSAIQLAGAVALRGGIPIVADGVVIGAIGVSGETPGIDEDIALAGAAATPMAIARAGTGPE